MNELIAADGDRHVRRRPARSVVKNSRSPAASRPASPAFPIRNCSRTSRGRARPCLRDRHTGEAAAVESLRSVAAVPIGHAAQRESRPDERVIVETAVLGGLGATGLGQGPERPSPGLGPAAPGTGKGRGTPPLDAQAPRAAAQASASQGTGEHGLTQHVHGYRRDGPLTPVSRAVTASSS